MNTRLTRYLSILLLVAVFGCSENVDTITYETPQVTVEGERELTIEVVDEEEATVSDYDITIEGPTSVSESGVGSSQYTFTDLQTGTYTITITKSGYIDAETEEDVELPEDAASGFTSELQLVLTEKSPPVTVDNSQETTVETAPSRNPGEEGLTTSLEIPAGTFPDDVVEEDGTVDLTVTRSTPNSFMQSEEGTVDDVILFEPEGTELNNPIQVSIPVVVPEELAGSIEYVLMPGNIQVELSETGESALVSTGVAQFNAVKQANGEIELLNQYRLVANVQVNQSGATYTSPEVIGTSGCGEALGPIEYSVEITPPGQIIQRFKKGFAKNSRTFTRSSREYSGVDGIKHTLRAQHKQITITVSNNGGGDVSTETVNLPAIKFIHSESSCHNSGGNT